MQIKPIILLGLAILAYAFVQTPKRTKPARFQQLQGWQKLFGFAALILAILILINPEFLALGLIGDTVFFDTLVLLLSLQLQTVVVRAWHSVLAVFLRATRRVIIPSPGTRYVLTVAALFIASAVSIVQKVVHRIFS